MMMGATDREEGKFIAVQRPVQSWVILDRQGGNVCLTKPGLPPGQNVERGL
jgi:hypothetical protein